MNRLCIKPLNELTKLRKSQRECLFLILFSKSTNQVLGKRSKVFYFLCSIKIYFSIKNRTYCTVYKVLQIRKLTRNKKIFSRCTAQLKEAYLISCYSSNTKNPIANEANVNLIIYISWNKLISTNYGCYVGYFFLRSSSSFLIASSKLPIITFFFRNGSPECTCFQKHSHVIASFTLAKRLVHVSVQWLNTYIYLH